MRTPWFRVRLSSLMLLVAVVAMFFVGMRYQEYREANRQAVLLATVARSVSLSYQHIDFRALFARGQVLWSCPHCDHGLEAPDDEGGQPHTCPKCGGRSTVPE